MLDALSHAIEAFWANDATDETKRYSIIAISLIRQYLNYC